MVLKWCCSAIIICWRVHPMTHCDVITALSHQIPLMATLQKRIISFTGISKCLSSSNSIVNLKTHNSIFNYYILLENLFFMQKITLSQKKIVSKLSCEQTIHAFYFPRSINGNGYWDYT